MYSSSRVFSVNNSRGFSHHFPESERVYVHKRGGGGAADAFSYSMRITSFFFVFLFLCSNLYFISNLEKKRQIYIDEEGKLGEGEEAGVFLTGGAGDPASPAALLQKADR